ncbi:hypothetical protein IQ254_18485 [Nodosilinea sp. LEGE 07088]|uniref:hypothetical protein n=1 Tax=Nodosilinea sp. LEGE 07088 TaxID=2777968 RepID=UPI0018815F2E|nr:hypothetical protein [Nodosilinea sp. LEGE 07088]MBE9139158.1 hypothetical protein [Nodosilinea sp. LEGE 07088]
MLNSVLSSIESIRYVVGDVGFGASLGALISAIAVLLNSWLQESRERKRWQREKLYELYGQAQEALTNLIQAMVSNEMTANSLGAYYVALGALDRLKLSSPHEQKLVISSAVDELKVMQSKGGAAIPYPFRDDIEAIRERISELAQADRRLGGLFQ